MGGDIQRLECSARNTLDGQWLSIERRMLAVNHMMGMYVPKNLQAIGIPLDSNIDSKGRAGETDL